MKEFFITLFDSGEGICTGNAFATEVHKYPKEGEFFCINPLDSLRDHGAFLGANYDEYTPRRADLNVTCFRNFMFEIDSLPLEDQLKLFNNSLIPFSTIVYSGGKSYHAILSVDGGAIGEEHTLEGIDNYKNIWRRLAARLDKEATRMGYTYPEGLATFIDASCKNPSRLSRFPDVPRDNGNRQEVVRIASRISKLEFNELLEKCPKVVSSVKQNFDTPEDEVETVENFEAVCPPELMRKLKYVDWAKSEGMYPYLLKFTLWAIDSTNVSKHAFLEFLDKYTFESLVNLGIVTGKQIRVHTF